MNGVVRSSYLWSCPHFLAGKKRHFINFSNPFDQILEKWIYDVLKSSQLARPSFFEDCRMGDVF